MAGLIVDDMVGEWREFLTVADSSGWLSILDDIVYDQRRIKKSLGKEFDVCPFPVVLLKYSDNPRFYQIKKELPEGTHSPAMPVPFYARNDDEAIDKLNQQIDMYNKSHPNLLRFERLEVAVYDKDFPGQLLRMLEHL